MAARTAAYEAPTPLPPGLAGQLGRIVLCHPGPRRLPGTRAPGSSPDHVHHRNPRGGLPVAVALSHKTDIPITMFANETTGVLWVDDIVDSGK